MNKIWFFGDSYTNGWGCNPGDEYYENHYKEGDKKWTELLAERFDKGIVDKSKNGSSNQGILRSIRENYFRIRPGDTVVMGQTHSSRIEFYYDQDKSHPLQIGQKYRPEYEHAGLDKASYSLLEQYSLEFVTHNRSLKHHLYQEFEFYKELLESNDVEVFLWPLNLYTSNVGVIEKIKTLGINSGHWTYNGHLKFYIIFTDYFNI